MSGHEIIQLVIVSTMGLSTLVGVSAIAVRVALVGPRLKAQRLAAAAAAAAQSGDGARLSARMDALEEEMRQLGQALERVAAVAEFDARLRAGAGQPRRLPEAGA